jgi:hypothetical protein
MSKMISLFQHPPQEEKLRLADHALHGHDNHGPGLDFGFLPAGGGHREQDGEYGCERFHGAEISLAPHAPAR